MGRFIGFAILAIVVLFTLAILFRGESVLDDAVSQMQQAAQDLTPIVEPPEPEEEPAEPVPPKRRQGPLPDLTRLFDSERRAKWRTREFSYVYYDSRYGRNPYQRIEYQDLESLDITTETSDQITIANAVLVVCYQVSPLCKLEKQAEHSPLLPRVYKESLHLNFEWSENDWYLDPVYFVGNPFDLKERDQENHLPRIPAHMSLTKYLFQEFRSRKSPEDPNVPPSDNPYGSTVSQTTP
ncbi:hypothetical protein M4951_00090 [Blastopirellula sp. J2-11]|uniref:hypothetical protein n=1 Tax=Blastopirellula sp. J2-11 TaxID=2943192 RepID=UPI0021C618CB|nr:hypothetical protein [Blastopirellula sp. J2-11]UUO06730.1 hypothetical protein M4951_00090 [Blastopirellula sp. J2-11]